MVMRYFQSKARLLTAAISTDLQVPELSAVPAGPIASLGGERVPERAALIAAQLLSLAGSEEDGATGPVRRAPPERNGINLGKSPASCDDF
jgi:hypothetical protein